MAEIQREVAPRPLVASVHRDWVTLDDGRYLPWDDLRHRDPPDGLTPALWWFSVRESRRHLAIPVDAMRRTFGGRFSFVETNEIKRAVHHFDRNNIRTVLLQFMQNEEVRTDYRLRQLIEEAISSSAIEGARPTTRELAREVIREGRTPANKDERMVVNNWLAMQRIVEMRERNRPMTLDDFLELHRILGEEALDVPDAAGKLRTNADTVLIEDQFGEVWHTPPPATDPSGRLSPLRDRVERLLRFAEGDDTDSPFIHPVLRAIVCHFWVGFEHPFRDGNGRIARALYYWVMLRHGYEMAEFLSISGPIDRKKTQYYRAFALVETDDGDLTYFIHHQLAIIEEALKDLVDHLQRRAGQTQALLGVISELQEFNHRQRALLAHAARHPTRSYTISGHAKTHRVHYQTARSDLIDLLDRRFLSVVRAGKGKRFAVSRQLKARLAKGRVSED